MSNEQHDKGPRTHTLAYGVKLTRDVDKLTREELIDELYNLAEFTSSKIIEARTMQSILQRRLEGR